MTRRVKDEVIQIGNMMICSSSLGPLKLQVKTDKMYIRCIRLELRLLRLRLLSAADCMYQTTLDKTFILFCFISALCEALQALPVEEV